MSERLRAVYREGVFVPQVLCDLPEDSLVDLIVERILPPEVNDPEKRKQLLAALIERMRQNPLPDGAPRLTREELHDRR